VKKLADLAVARFTGADAGAFLQAQLSADIGALEPGDSTFACYCSPRGQVYGLMLVGRSEDQFLVVAAAALLPAMLQRLRMFVLRSRVDFSIVDELAVYGLTETASLPVPVAILSPAVPGLHYGLSGEIPDGALDPTAWKEKELRNKVSWLGAGSSEKFIPQMLGFDAIGAVSFTKGCYPGQEIVARARYLGKVKRKPLLVLVESSGDFLIGSSVRLQRNSEWSNGSIVDTAVVPGKGTLLFVVAPEEPVATVEQLQYDGKDYRCATI